ncbi:HopJ type III effector protein [Marinobacter daqiaonensis]|uniref:HopJ type III effector protein n=1 Tax=Marinobacter daqiaonensis TaxID=650891 RepID=A0A1I6J6X9_9GAMM|nr:HopJ type III effector protein [Marinobacter daqiaonensis]SFR74651.1 HopJ type III effector protein [Marinobacter daqiaonensis]
MNLNEALRIHLASLDAGHSDFEDTLTLLERYFDYLPAGFHNGPLYNRPGENEGSCRIFALGQFGNLGEAQTLSLFGRHYRSVLDDPAGSNHGNIRQFMTTGWSGIRFEGPVLRPAVDKNPSTQEIQE